MAPVDLASILDHVDDWFTDISLSTPIKHFRLDEDRAQLATISRTTGIWFKSLTSNPPLTSDGIDDVDMEDSILNRLECNNDNSAPTQLVSRSVTRSHRNNRKRRRVKACTRNEEHKFDLLVRDLENLLDQEEVCQLEPQIFSYSYQSTDELSLLDSTLGSCCTLDYQPLSHSLESNKRVKLDSTREYSVIFENNLDDQSHKIGMCGDRSPDLTKQHSTPIDHDYLARPQSKPLMSSNRQFHNLGLKLRSARVLNTEALKRFAPFSNKIKDLIDRHDRPTAPTIVVAMAD